MGGFGFKYNELKAKADQYSFNIDNLDFFIETGTHRGATVMEMAPFFPNVWSIELSESLYNDFKPHVNELKNVKTFLGASEEVLPRLCKEAEGDAVFYLDAHYCHGVTAKGQKDCPMIDELIAIKERPYNDIIICDDVMYFDKVTTLAEFPTEPLDWSEVKIELIKNIFGNNYNYIEDDDKLYIIQNKWHAEDIYNQDGYFQKSDGALHWKAGMLKYGDSMCAICYALGIDSFEKIQNIYNFHKTLDATAEYHSLSPLLSDPAWPATQSNCGASAKEQVNLAMQNQIRTPNHVLEIGAGRGEVSVAFSSLLNIKTTSLEPNKNFTKLINQTTYNFNIRSAKGHLNIINKDVVRGMSDVDWDTIDTVVMVESLEHILKEDFDKIYPKIINSLTKNSGRFIIVNWLNYHPLTIGQHASAKEHCRLIDDELYDNFSKDAKKVIYRNGSHIVLEF